MMSVPECTIVNNANLHITFSNEKGEISAREIRYPEYIYARNVKVVVARGSEIGNLWRYLLELQQYSYNGVGVRKVHSVQVCDSDGRLTVVIGPYGIKGGCRFFIFDRCYGKKKEKKKTARVGPLGTGEVDEHIPGPREAFRLPKGGTDEALIFDSDDEEDSMRGGAGSIGPGRFLSSTEVSCWDFGREGSFMSPRSSMRDSRKLLDLKPEELKGRSASSTFPSTFTLPMGVDHPEGSLRLKATRSARVYDGGARSSKIEVLIVSSDDDEIEEIGRSLPKSFCNVKCVGLYSVAVEMVRQGRVSVVLLDESCTSDMEDIEDAELISAYCRNVVYLYSDDDAYAVWREPGVAVEWKKRGEYDETFVSMLRMMFKQSQELRLVTQTMRFMPSLTLNVDRRGVIKFSNKGNGKMSLPGADVGKSIYELFLGDVSDALKDGIRFIYRGKGSRQVMKPLWDMGSGVRKWITFYMEPVFTPSGDVENVLINCVDVTEQKVAALCLEELKVRAERVAAETKSMACFLAHEGRGALVGMEGHIDELEERGIEGLGGLRASTKWLNGVFSGALEYSKARSGKVRCEERPFEIEKLLKKIKKISPRKKRRGVEVINGAIIIFYAFAQRPL
jgi:hypothetical protein